jgi:AcrR family transcriptional regulator
MGGKIPRTDDRRVQRTRRALRDALVALILERGWEGFSVQDLCERADVGRSTFYIHFADKEELLGWGFDDLRDGLLGLQASEGGPARPLRFSRGLIEHACEHRPLFRALVGHQSGTVVLRRFSALVRELVREDLSALLPAGPRRDATIAFVAGAFLELLSWSLELRSPPTPAEVEARFQELAGPVVAVARRPPPAA